MENTMFEDPKKPVDPTKADGDKAPPDPSNTSNIGQPVETGLISKKEGISEQSNEWEDHQERDIPGESLINERADKYIKDPSPEENGE